MCCVVWAYKDYKTQRSPHGKVHTFMMPEQTDCVYSADDTSVIVELSTYDTLGFCEDYLLRRHKHEGGANKGSQEARTDWIQYIGPLKTSGGCNPFNGHFASLVLPMCKPERLRIVSYVLEYAFLYDDVLESASEAARTLDANSDHLVLNETNSKTVRSVTGTKQIQAKMILELLELDKEKAENVIDIWKVMVATTASRDKTVPFQDLEEYVSYRIVDTGAPFVGSIMLFGMALSLSAMEKVQLEHIVRPCYAALGLANDYFSFDIEYENFVESGAVSMTNAVWLFMQWHMVGVDAAKVMVKKETIRYEHEFQVLRKDFLQHEGQQSPRRIKAYLAGLGYQVVGNLVWSLTCPRYHPENRYVGNSAREEDSLLKPSISAVNSGLEVIQNKWDELGGEVCTASLESKYQSSDISSGANADSEGLWHMTRQSASISSDSPISSVSEEAAEPRISKLRARQLLSTKHVLAPFEYISSLPSKGVRDTFIDAFNVWLTVPESMATIVKSIVAYLHHASLMLDDIEDSSDLRRGMPATHVIFGQAQTTNAANFMIITALEEVHKLNNQLSITIFIEEMQDLLIGQSYDLYWTRNTTCPTEESYLAMVEKKTGGLFKLSIRLLLAQVRLPYSDFEDFISLIGRYFQIRDDYKNLQSVEYTSRKGFCEDFDEGKYSYPLIHALNSNPKDLQLSAILQARRDRGSLSKELKILALEKLQETSSLEHTQNILKSLQDQISMEVGVLERRLGRKNWVMRVLLKKLNI